MKRVVASAEKWWEYSSGSSTVWVLADSALEACRKAEAYLRDLGILPGGPPGLHESFERMREAGANRAGTALTRPLGPARFGPRPL
jgi:hypothetical protein